MDAAVPVKERDYLDQDPEIRGQKYACVSFVSPEDVLAKKDVFLVSKFVENFSKDLSTTLDNLIQKFSADRDAQHTLISVRDRHASLFDPAAMQEEFRAFSEENSESLDEEFRSENGFQTSVRGFKIRGVYGDVESASDRAKSIRKFDDKFNVYVAEVGCWCPWDPCADLIKDVQYQETELNTIMKGYVEAQEAKRTLYADRKAAMQARLDEDEKAKKEAAEAEISTSDEKSAE